MNNSDTLGMNRKERRAAGFVREHKYDWHAPSNIPSPEISKESNELCDLQDCTIQEGVIGDATIDTDGAPISITAGDRGGANYENKISNSYDSEVTYATPEIKDLEGHLGFDKK